VETRQGLRVIQLRPKAYTPLHIDLEREVGKVRLTGEEVGVAEEHGVEGETLHGIGLSSHRDGPSRCISSRGTLGHKFTGDIR
jgi:hypothetical protein